MIDYVSPDTISGVYSYPEVIEKRDGYAYGEDYYFYDRHKLYIEYNNRNGEYFIGLVDKEVKDFSVMEDYFNRLVKMAILDGAGITEMFMTEAENARAEYLEAEKIKQEKAAALEAERLARLNEGNIFTNLWYRFNYAVTDTASAIAGAVSNTVATIGSNIYNGTSLAVNNTRNFVNGLTYTGNVLATIGAQAVERTVSSVSKKVVLYIRENSSNFITPALAYTPPAPNSPSITQSDFSRLVSILSVINNSNQSDDTQDEKPVRHSSGGHRDRTPEPEPVLAVIEPAPVPEVVESEPEEVIIIPVPVIDTTAPEVAFGPVLKCQDTLSDEVCLLRATSSVMFDFSFLSISTDISFYTLSVDDGDPEDFASATTSENTMSMELTEDYEYIISLTATDISGNTSATTSAKIALYPRPVVISEVVWFQVNSEDYAQNIVLYNDTPYDINLSGWTLVTTNNTASSTFDLSLTGTIRTNDVFNLKKEIPGDIDENVDQWYTGTFGRESEYLNLNSPSGFVNDFKLKFEEYFSC